MDSVVGFTLLVKWRNRLENHAELLEKALLISRIAAKKCIKKKVVYLSKGLHDPDESFLLWNHPISENVLYFLHEDFFNQSCNSIFQSSNYKKYHVENIKKLYEINPDKFISNIIKSKLFINKACIWLLNKIHSSLNKTHKENLKEWKILSDTYINLESEKKRFTDFTNTMQLDLLVAQMLYTIECIRMIKVSQDRSFASNLFLQEKSELMDFIINEWLENHKECLDAYHFNSACPPEYDVCNKLIKGFKILEDYDHFNFLLTLYTRGEVSIVLKGQTVILRRKDDENRLHWRKQHYKYILENTFFSNYILFQTDNTLELSLNQGNTHFLQTNCIQFASYHMPNELTAVAENNFALMSFFSELIFNRNQQLFNDSVISKISTFKEAYSHLIKAIADYYMERKYPNPYICKQHSEFKESLQVINKNHYDTDSFLNRYLFNIKDYSDQNKYSFGKYPIISNGESTIIPACMLMPYNFARTEFNRIFEQWSDKEIKEYSDSFEKIIAQVFVDSGFKATHGLKFYEQSDSEKKKTLCEADIIAVKGNAIIICELKLTSMKTNNTSIYKYKDRVYFSKAVEQLQKIKSRLLDHQEWKTLPDELSKSLSADPEVFSFILSNNFEGDGEQYPDGILKLSVFELNILLSNSAHLLFDYDLIYEEALKRKNLTMRDFEDDPQSLSDPDSLRFLEESFDDVKKDFNLFTESGPITAELLTELIRDEKAWSILKHIGEEPCSIISMKYGEKCIHLEI